MYMYLRESSYTFWEREIHYKNYTTWHEQFLLSRTVYRDTRIEAQQHTRQQNRQKPVSQAFHFIPSLSPSPLLFDRKFFSKVHVNTCHKFTRISV